MERLKKPYSPQAKPGAPLQHSRRVGPFTQGRRIVVMPKVPVPLCLLVRIRLWAWL